jgi:hypothetical protein
MRYLFFALGYFVISLALAQQKSNTIEKIYFSKTQAKTCEEVEVIFELTLLPESYVYSHDLESEGTIKYDFTFVPDSTYQLAGKVEIINLQQKYYEMFEANMSYFNKKIELRQKIKILSDKFNLKGSFSFQICSNINKRCLASKEVPFSLNTKNIKITGITCK